MLNHWRKVLNFFSGANCWRRVKNVCLRFSTRLWNFPIILKTCQLFWGWKVELKWLLGCTSGNSTCQLFDFHQDVLDVAGLLPTHFFDSGKPDLRNPSGDLGTEGVGQIPLKTGEMTLGALYGGKDMCTTITIPANKNRKPIRLHHLGKEPTFASKTQDIITSTSCERICACTTHSLLAWF